MQIKRSATARWEGSGKTGNGIMSTQSTVLHDAQYSYNTRFEDGIGTNPEELIGAAHAGCFSMKLAFVLQAAGFTADSIETKASVVLESGSITTVQLETSVKVPGVSLAQLEEFTADAKANCPVSKLLNAEITLTTILL
ncbi:MAG TPA: OsmC family protein [Haliscomenobacter sp.]|uniref:OsmC family protein n=1 Tax=Haliscomenobacter sp. TaxID=2717303 RepID=UPI001D537B88|nr:OsmC family protein [Haliscomenobacter sp.]MBK9492420.1 OsmC family protein [Haliscomenobacter sp.]HOY17218.1 OsmC family protein [Haliscomenobacter sp.]HPH17225.1 OsmC family protein [Haliscomenobacter sp.]